MKRNYCLFKIAILLVIGGAFCFVRATAGQQLRICDGQGPCTWNGFSRSTGDPNVRGPAELMITSQHPPPDPDFEGSIMILGNTYTIRGKVYPDGSVSFTSGRTGVTGKGQLQDLTRGGALIGGTYKLSSGDQGELDFLRNFTQPPDPGPPDISGSWRGTYENILSLMRGTDELMVEQERTPNGAPGTGFTGQETLDGGTPAVVLYQFAGTADAQGNFVLIGVSAEGLLIGGGRAESGQLTATTVRHAADGLLLDVVTASRL
jgi:hypothetical protein